MPSLFVDEDASGDTVLVAAPGAGKMIQVFGVNLTANAAVIPLLKDGAGTTLWGSLAANRADTGGGIVLNPWADRNLFCAPNTTLVLNLSGAVRVMGTIDYAVVPAPV